MEHFIYLYGTYKNQHFLMFFFFFSPVGLKYSKPKTKFIEL